MARKKDNTALLLLALGGAAFWFLRPKEAAAIEGPSQANCVPCAQSGGMYHPEYGCLRSPASTPIIHAAEAAGRNLFRESGLFCAGAIATPPANGQGSAALPAGPVGETEAEIVYVVYDNGNGNGNASGNGNGNGNGGSSGPGEIPAYVERIACTGPGGVPLPRPITPGTFPAEGCTGAPTIPTPLSPFTQPLPPAYAWSVPIPGGAHASPSSSSTGLNLA